jgi:hypothetical protein
MKNFKVKTAKHRVELTNDLITVFNASGDLIHGVAVPVLEAAERFKLMVERVKRMEAKG